MPSKDATASRLGDLKFPPNVRSMPWAYGIHSGSSNDGCHVAGNVSLFSSLPDINAHWDATAAARIRVDTR
jgi:hypothetical protein